MLSSDSDDVPLLLHRSQRETPRKPAKSRSPSPLPDWLSQPASSPAKALETLDDSDDHAETGTEPSRDMEYGTQRGRGAAAEQTTQAANGGKVARAKRGRPALETSSESEAEEPRPALKRLKSTAKTNQKLASAAKTSKPGKSQQQGIAAWLKKEGTPAAEPEPMPNSAAGEGPVELPAPSQKQAGKGPHQQTGSQKAAKLATETTTGLLAVEGEVPIMMPAKLATNKVIMELQSGSEAEAVDLSGDAGVVGRWLVQGSTESPELLMDLKGVLFSATPVPSASTLCVVNLTATEAKVEVLTSDFVQLRPEATQGGAGDEDAQDDCFMYDDDDNYQYEGGTQAKGQDDEAGAATAGRAKKPKAGAVAKKATKKAGAKPARKKPGKAAAGAKGRKKK